MNKVFCDKCNRQITNALNNSMSFEPPIEVNGRKYTIDTLINTVEICAEPDLCRYCIIDAFKASDDRIRIIIGPPATP